MAYRDRTVLLENVRLIYKNFEGRAGRYNEAGKRNFGVVLTEEMAAVLKDDGWNVKMTRGNEEYEEDPEPFISVKVSYVQRPPVIVLIGEKGRTHLTEDTISILDMVDIEKADLIVNPSNYIKVEDGSKGKAAYLRSIYVTLKENKFDQKYGTYDDLLADGGDHDE